MTKVPTKVGEGSPFSVVCLCGKKELLCHAVQLLWVIYINHVLGYSQTLKAGMQNIKALKAIR